MDCKAFSRGLRNGSFDKVNRFFQSPVGRAIIDTQFEGQPAFQICLRDNYFNVYWRGCSVLKYSPIAPNNTFLIHPKYTE